ncbi:MAG: FtsX-like permease family protein [Eubacteriales bacterium]|nr:FtsX-like permease family protein [Eubacteriales bacterium]
MVLRKRIPRQLLKHKGRFISLIFLIFLGSMTLTMLNMVVTNLQGSFDWLTEVGKADDIRVWTLNEPSNLESLGKILNADVEARTAVDAKWQDDITLRVFEVNYSVDQPVILDGNALQRDSDILLDPAFAAMQKLAIGDTIELAGRTFWISGYMALPDYIYPTHFETDLVTDPASFGVAVVTKRAIMQLVSDAPAEDWTVDRSYGIRFHPGFALNQETTENQSQTIYQDLKDRFKDRYGLVRWLERKDNIRINMVKSEIAGQKAMSKSLPVAIFMINIVLLASVLWRMIRMEFQLIGTLRAQGLSKMEVLRHYLTLPLTLAVIGGISGTLGGIGVARPFLVYYTQFFALPLKQAQYDPLIILSGTLIPVLLLGLTATYVVMRAVKLPPKTLMRGFRRKPKAMFIERLFRFHNLKFAMKFRARQMVRSAGKLFGAAIGVAFASMMMLTGFLMSDSYSSFMGDGLSDIFQYEKNYVFKTEQSINRYDGEQYQMLAARTLDKGYAILIEGLPENSQLLKLTDKSGQTIDLKPGSKACIITRVLADKMKIGPGDVISFINDIDDEIHYIRISGVAEIYTLSTVFIPLDEFNRRFDRPKDSFIGLYSIQTHHIPSEDLLLTEDMNDLLTSLDSYTNLMRISLLSIGFFASLMALVILYILFSLLIDENGKTIALLKILGYETREIRTLMLRIFDAPFLIGFILGIPMLFNFYGALMAQSFQEINMTMPLYLSTKNIVSGFAILYITYVLTRNISGRKILKIDMTDVLKSIGE